VLSDFLAKPQANQGKGRITKPSNSNPELVQLEPQIIQQKWKLTRYNTEQQA